MRLTESILTKLNEGDLLNKVECDKPLKEDASGEKYR